MHTRERILTIRLMEKVKKNPVYAKALGIAIEKERWIPQDKTQTPSAGGNRK